MTGKVLGKIIPNLVG